MTVTTDQKLALISRNTKEIVKEEELRALLESGKQPSVYIGTAITGSPHIGYYVWVLKMADFINAGFKVKVLLADLHGALDNCPWDVLEKRYEYYKAAIQGMFKSIGADLSKVEFVRGSSFQLSKEYVQDLLKLSSFTSINDAKRAGSEVVKFGDNPKLSGLIYPLMQALDEQYLDVDVQYGGIDQRKILMFARENLPKLGYKARVEVMTPLIPGLSGKKMSGSDPKSKVDLLDDATTVANKLKGAYCEAGVVEDNGVLAFLEHVIMPRKQDSGESFVISRPEKYGGNLEFASFEALKDAFVAKQIHPLDLKNSLAVEVSALLEPLCSNESLRELRRQAYE